MDAAPKVLPDYRSEAIALEYWLGRYRHFLKLKDPSPEDVAALFDGGLPPPLKADELAQYLVMRWLRVLEKANNAREEKLAMCELRKVLANMTRLEAVKEQPSRQTKEPEEVADDGFGLGGD